MFVLYPLGSKPVANLAILRQLLLARLVLVDCFFGGLFIIFFIVNFWPGQRAFPASFNSVLLCMRAQLKT